MFYVLNITQDDIVEDSFDIGIKDVAQFQFIGLESLKIGYKYEFVCEGERFEAEFEESMKDGFVELVINVLIDGELQQAFRVIAIDENHNESLWMVHDAGKQFNLMGLATYINKVIFESNTN